MALSKQDLALIDAKFEGLTKLMNAHFENVADGQNAIIKRQDLTNGRVTGLENRENGHIINCPVAPKVRTIEDTLLSQKSIKGFMAIMFSGGIAVGGLIVAIIKLF